MVLACLADVRCKADCLELGAPDYLTKPFSLAGLLARVHTQLRGEGLDAVIRAVSSRCTPAAWRRTWGAALSRSPDWSSWC